MEPVLKDDSEVLLTEVQTKGIVVYIVNNGEYDGTKVLLNQFNQIGIIAKDDTKIDQEKFMKLFEIWHKNRRV